MFANGRLAVTRISISIEWFRLFIFETMKTILLIATIMVSSYCHAQKIISGSFELPTSETYLAVDWDCTKTVFEKKYNESEWSSINGEKEWNEAKSEAMGLILRKMNDELEKSRIMVVRANEKLKASYTMYICPLKLDRKGNNVSQYVIKANSNGEELGRIQVNGDGGHWGTFANLLGDGYEEAAKKVGKFINKKNKK